ncbi:MAG: FG-GAP-like repeat-containing protein [Chloroflexota bacterium]
MATQESNHHSTSSPTQKRWVLRLILTFLVAGTFFLSIAPVIAHDPNPLNGSPIWRSGGIETTSSVAWGDVDGDGDLDLAVGNGGDFNGQKNKVYLNQNGVLQTDIESPWEADVLDSTHDLAWGDLDNDGDLDLVVANSGQNFVYLNENGSLNTVPTIFSTDFHDTRTVALADVDGDRDFDVAFGNNDAPDQIYINDSTPGDFQLTLNWTDTVTQPTQSLAWADYDLDDDLDLGIGRDGANKIYRNDGLNGANQLQFVEVWTSSDTSFTTDIIWGDLNEDNYPDLVAGNRNSNCCLPAANKIYFNQFGVVQTTSTWIDTNTSATVGVALVDIDNDDDLDLMTSNFFADHRLYLNDFGVISSEGLAGIGGNNDDAGQLAFADVDRNGSLDMALAIKGNSSKLFFNQAEVANEVLQTADDNPATFGNNRSTWQVAWGDVNNDGYLDLAVGNGTDQDGKGVPNEVFLNVGGQLEATASWTDALTDVTTSVAWGDMDGDGDLDLAVGNGDVFSFGNGGSANKIYRNDDGTLALPPVWVSPELDTTMAVAWGDMDGDGDLDLAVANEYEANRIYRTDGLLGMASVWTSTNQFSTQSVAWGDIDQDGDLDLAFGNRFETDTVYENDGLGGMTQIWNSGNQGATQSVAWGDVDGDGDLDLATGNENGVNYVYLNQNGVLQTAFDNPWQSSDDDSTFSVSWGDADGDGDLDLAVGNRFATNKVYFNENGVLQTESGWQDDSPFGDTVSVAWGDVNGDGALDLAVGNLLNGSENRVYLNTRPTQPSATAAEPPAVSLIPGATALAPANFFAQSNIIPGVVSLPVTYTLFHPNGQRVKQVRAFYSPDGGGQWLPAKADTTQSATTNLVASPYPTVTANNTHVYYWDLSKSNFFGLSDNVVFRLEAVFTQTTTAPVPPPAYSIPGPFLWPAPLPETIVSSQTYPFRVRGQQIQVLQAGTPVQDAFIYRLPTGIETVGTLIVNSEGEPARTNESGYLEGRLSMTEGDQLIAMLPVSGTTSTQQQTSSCKTYTSVDVPQVIPNSTLSTVVSLLSVPDEGTIVDVNVVNLRGTHTYMGDLSFELYSPEGIYAEIMQPSCGFEQNFDLNLDDQASQFWPCPPVGGGTYLPSQPLSAFNGQDSDGQWALVINDLYELDGGQLDSWGLEICTTAETKSKTSLYLTSAQPTANGLNGKMVDNQLIQQITIPDDQYLLLFDLEISLEWDASDDAEFLGQLKFDLIRASEFLFDATNGQAALGDLTIHYNKNNWDTADIQVHASNTLIPNADVGGIVTAERADDEITSHPDPNQTVPYTIVYNPGAVRIGSAWNRFGEASGTAGEDRPRTLVHELGHYLFYLYDNYVGLDNEGHLIPVTSCTGTIMTNPFENSEFHTTTDWQKNCSSTISARRSGRSDWATIHRFYPFLSIPENNFPGPVVLPLPVTEISESLEGVLPPSSLSPVFSLKYTSTATYIAGRETDVILYTDKTNNGYNRVIDLGKPILDQVRVRGALPGDRLCIYDKEDSRIDPGVLGSGNVAGPFLACELLSEDDATLTMVEQKRWQPEIIISPVNSRTLVVQVSNIDSGLSLKGKFYPEEDNATEAQTFAGVGTVYSHTFVLEQTAEKGYIQIWVDESDSESQPRREVTTSYALGGSACTPPRCTCSGPGCRGTAAQNNNTSEQNFNPAISIDGQVQLYANTVLSEGQFYAIQKATQLPNAPAWATVVGNGYHILKTAQAPSLVNAITNTVSLNFRYRGQDVPPGEEPFLTLYYWRPDVGAGTWQKLETTRNATYNEVAAKSQGAGLYALMSSLEIPLYQSGWNLVSYPVQETRPVTEALASLGENYLSVYGLSTSDESDPWKVYAQKDSQDAPVPDWVNDLTTLEFGQGYWINVTEAMTLSLQGASNRSVLSVPSPPATYYGTISATVGSTLNAYVDGVLCGTTTIQTQLLDGQSQTTYVIDVHSSDVAGCGANGKSIQFQLDGASLGPIATWQNDRVQRHDLGELSLDQRFYFPLIFSQKGLFNGIPEG